MTANPVTKITLEESALLEACKALDLQETDGDAIHMVLRGGRRHWLARTTHGQFSATVDDHTLGEVDLHLALSDRITWFLTSIEDNEPSIGMADGSKAVIASTHTSVTIDLIAWEGPAPEPYPITVQASATLPIARFAKTLAAARLMPSGLEPAHYPTPPMWLQISPGSVGLNVDWRDFTPTTSTYTMEADATEETAVAAIDHLRIDRFLHSVDGVLPFEEDTELTIGIGEMTLESGSQPVVVLIAEDWQLALPVVDVLADRWGRQVTEQLREFAATGLTLTETSSTSWVVDLEHCVVQVGLQAGHPDQVRISTCLATGVTDSADLLRELSNLNAASQGERLWCADECLWAAMDLPCTRLDELRTTVTRVGTVAQKYAPLLTGLG
jgi:hypothetical protein